MVEAWDKGDKARLGTGHARSPSTTRSIPATGTIKLKAEFANEDGALFPNQFVNMRLVVETLYGVTVVPAAAVQRGSAGPVRLRGRADKRSRVTPVDARPPEGRTTWRSARRPPPGDGVVMNGADKLREGVKVQPHASRGAARAAGRGRSSVLADQTARSDCHAP